MLYMMWRPKSVKSGFGGATLILVHMHDLLIYAPEQLLKIDLLFKKSARKFSVVPKIILLFDKYFSVCARFLI